MPLLLSGKEDITGILGQLVVLMDLTWPQGGLIPAYHKKEPGQPRPHGWAYVESGIAPGLNDASAYLLLVKITGQSQEKDHIDLSQL